MKIKIILKNKKEVKKMSKKGISPLIATVLIIGFTIVLAAVVMQWGGAFVRSLTEEQAVLAEGQTNCIKLNFDMTATIDLVKITNNADVVISKVLIQKIDAAGTSSTLKEDETDISGYEAKSFDVTTGLPSGVTAPVEGDTIRVIPYVQLANGDDYGCGKEVAKEYKIPITAV